METILLPVLLSMAVVSILAPIILSIIFNRSKAGSQNSKSTSIFNVDSVNPSRVPSPHFVLQTLITPENVRRVMNRGTRVKTMMGARRARSSTRS